MGILRFGILNNAIQVVPNYLKYRPQKILKAFELACYNDRKTLLDPIINLAKELDKPIDVHANDERIFNTVCAYGYVDIVEWLLRYGETTNTPIDIHANSDDAFISACVNGYDRIYDMLLAECHKRSDRFDIHKDDEYIFRQSCANGRLNIVKKLLEYDNTIDIHAMDNFAFRYSCLEEHIETVKFLIDKGIDIRENNDEIFKECCRQNKIKIARWLVSMYPGYTFQIKGWKIASWNVKDWRKEINLMEHLTSTNNHHLLQETMNIEIIQTVQPQNCSSCNISKNYMIELECGDMCCPECIVKREKLRHRYLCPKCHMAYRLGQCKLYTPL